MQKKSQLSSTSRKSLTPVLVAPSRVLKGEIAEAGEAIAYLGKRPLIVGGDRSLSLAQTHLQPVLEEHKLETEKASYHPDCSENTLARLKKAVAEHRSDFIIGIGGGKALDTAKLVAHQCQLPVVTIPTSGATCAAWAALSNVYSDRGAFQYGVALNSCPELLILDYNLIRTAPKRTLIAGIGDAIAKWYESSISSGDSTHTLIIAAVQQARILRDILFQKSAAALESPGSEEWREVIDATVLLAGVVGGLGGSKCRTVAAHAVHNGLTQIEAAGGSLHGEKVAYGILVQLRLEEMLQGNQLAVPARKQLLEFYNAIGVPKTLEDLGLKDISLKDLRLTAESTCNPRSDIHNLPFSVSVEQLMAAMVSTTVGFEKEFVTCPYS